LLIFALFSSCSFSAVADATWSAIIDRLVIIMLPDSQEITGMGIS
jgi:hypothetical protein